MLACDRLLPQLVLNNILLKVSSLAPYSGDISSCRAAIRLCCGLHIRGPTLIRKLFFANPARLARFDGPPTGDESFIFPVRGTDSSGGGLTVTDMKSLYAVF
jgi:hypothetical protein